MKTQTIRFKFKGKTYTFSRPHNNPKVDQNTTLAWIRQCYKSIGAKSKEVSCKEVTFTNWGFWSKYSD